MKDEKEPQCDCVLDFYPSSLILHPFEVAGLAGLEPATFCFEDRRSNSTELQAQDESKVQCQGNPHRRWTLDVGLWTKLWSGREAAQPLETPRSRAVAVLPG